MAQVNTLEVVEVFLKWLLSAPRTPLQSAPQSAPQGPLKASLKAQFKGRVKAPLETPLKVLLKVPLKTVFKSYAELPDRQTDQPPDI